MLVKPDIDGPMGIMSHVAASAAIRRKLHPFWLPVGKGGDRVSTGPKTPDPASFTPAASELTAAVVFVLLKVVLSSATERPYSVVRGSVTVFETALAVGHPRISVLHKHFYSFRDHPALPREPRTRATIERAEQQEVVKSHQSSALFTCRGITSQTPASST